ncbi:hypothetical protein HanPSC8_Chr14g0618051 [Helianthus annuus]|nr:hypothetical protein HanPSC8_Chr14g0618051 [Helianthus annuus]
MWDTCPILRAIDFVGFPLNLLDQFFLPDPYQIPVLFLTFPTFSLFYLTTETQTLNAVNINTPKILKTTPF